MQEFQFRRTKAEADDYGNGKFGIRIISQRLGNQARYGNLLDGERHAIMYNL